MKRLSIGFNFLYRIVLVFFCIMAIRSLGIALNNFTIIICAIVTITVLYGLFVILKNAKSKKIIYIIIVAALAIRILYYFIVGVKQNSDFKVPFQFFEIWKTDHMKYTYTNLLSELDRFVHRNYYARFPCWGTYGFVVWALLFLFGNHEAVVFAFNLCIIGLTLLYLYKSLDKKATNGLALFATIVYSFSPTMICWASISCPDHIILLFTVLFIYQWTKFEESPESFNSIILMALFSGMAVLFKPILPLFPCILAFFFVADCKSIKGKDSIKKRIKGIGIYLMSFICISFVLKNAVYFGLQKVIQTDIVDSTPFYIAWGYATNEDGQLDSSAWDYLIKEARDSSETNAEFMDKLREAEKPLVIQSIPLLPQIWMEKFNQLMSDTTFPRFWSLMKSDTVAAKIISENSRVVCLFFVPPWLAELIAVMFSVAKKDKINVFTTIGWLGCVCYLVCASVQARYRMIFMIYHYIMVTFGVVGMSDIVSFIKRKIREETQSSSYGG